MAHFAFVLWIEVSLLAIAFVGQRPYVGLAIAVLGGVAVGWIGLASAGGQVGRAAADAKETENAATGWGAKARRAAEWVADRELWFLALPIVLLILPHRLAPWGLVVIFLLWPIRWVARGRLTVRTPVDVPLSGLLAALPLSLYASADLARSRTTLYQILAGLALFYGLVNALRSERDVGRMATLLILGGGGMALIAPLGTTWGKSRLFNLPSIYQRFPRLLSETVNANVLAGALVILIPVGVCLLLQACNSARSGSPDPGPPLGEHSLLGEGLQPGPQQPPRRQDNKLFKSLPCAFVPLWLNPCRWVYNLALGLALVLMLAITILTQSRGAYAALGIGLLLLAILLNRWFVLLSLAAVLGLAVAIQRIGSETLADLLLTTDALGGWAGRQELWSRAVYMIQDFPYTGGGLGTFGKVVPVLYPLFLIGPDVDVGHAHNLFLQVAVDLGLPGLVAFVNLFSGALMAAWKAYRAYGARKEVGPQRLALGLLISLVVMGLHGLTDAVTWGTKPAIIPWGIMGLTMALCRVSEQAGMKGRSGGGFSLEEMRET